MSDIKTFWQKHVIIELKRGDRTVKFIRGLLHK